MRVRIVVLDRDGTTHLALQDAWRTDLDPFYAMCGAGTSRITSDEADRKDVCPTCDTKFWKRFDIQPDGKWN